MSKIAEGRGGRKANSRSFKKGRKPHNASPELRYESFEDLVKKVAAEPRKVMRDGAVVEMSRGERALRLLVERAITGKAREVALLIKLMSKHPSIAKSAHPRIQIFIRGALGND